MVLNKGLLEIGGVAVPNTIMANNKTEARERAEREGLYFAFAFIAPFICLPFFNKSFLKLAKISKQPNGFEDKIMHVSKKYLTKDGKYLEEGINNVLKDFENKKNHNHKNYDKIKEAFDNILKTTPDKEVLRKKLIKVHSNVLLSDFLVSGLTLISIPWISNFITTLRTGKAGFSAKFNMVDEKTRKEESKEFEKTKKLKMAALITSVLGAGLLLSVGLKTGLLAKNTSHFGNFVKKHASKFDYKDGIFMSRTILLIATLFADFPSGILSCRDKDEVKYSLIRNIAIDSMFFGGDIAINAVAARVIDGTCGTKLLDESDLKEKNTLWRRLSCPTKTFKEIEENKINLDAKTLSKTKKAGIGMFWGNFAILCAMIGFGLPYILNKNLKENVAKKKEKQ